MMKLALIVLGLAGCSFAPPDCAEGYRRDDGGTCQLVPADEDTGVEPLSCPLTGPISIDVTAILELLEPISDTCSGLVCLERTGDQISGTVTCQFEGQVNGLLGGETFEGNLSGIVGDDYGLSGPFVLELGIFGVLDTSWTGALDYEGLSGEFSGDLLVDVQGVIEANVAYSGDFKASP